LPLARLIPSSLLLHSAGNSKSFCFPRQFACQTPVLGPFLPFLLPCVTGAARIPHRLTPQILHLAQIPLTRSLLTSSPCSLSRSRPAPALPLAGFAPPRAAPPLAPPSSAPPSTARLATPPTNPCKGIAPPHPSGAHARAMPPCSPAVRRERRCAATAAAPHRRRQCPVATRWAPPLPISSLGPVGRA
jgi:hypothetical protein